jgi:hypothetical protein
VAVEVRHEDPQLRRNTVVRFVRAIRHSAVIDALTGRVVELKVEADGDLHIALHDATGDKPDVVVCEIPAKPQWCEIRTTVFSWTPTRFPFHTGSAKKLTFGQSPIITVIGKAYWDVGHAPKDQSNRRKYMPDYAVWEIHPVMKLEVVK